jgi:hypothetical protein
MMDNMPVMTEILKRKYCLKAPDTCARYQVAKKLGGGRVPDDLYPSHHDRVQAIVEGSESVQDPPVSD